MWEQRTLGAGREQGHWDLWMGFGGESKGEMSVFITENSAGSVKGGGNWRCMPRGERKVVACAACAFLEEEQNSGRRKSKRKSGRSEKLVKSGKKSPGTVGLAFS